MKIIDALDKGDLDLARNLLLQQVYSTVKDRNSWDSPNYTASDLTKETQKNILLDSSRDKLLTFFGLQVLSDRYLLKDSEGQIVETPQKFFARVAAGLSENNQELAQNLYDIISNLWFMPATPILTNISTDRGNLISCFLQYMGDSIKDIYKTVEECAFLGSGGGGLGVYMGDIRGQGAKIKKTMKSSGTIPFMKVLDSNTLAITQGGVRRASAATYLDIDHPDCEEFINIRKPTGGDDNRKCLNLHHGVNITDKFMEAVKAKQPWDLICPHTGDVVKTVDAFTLWKKILTNRVEIGEPYIHFIDTTNKAILPEHKKRDLFVKQSNLCCVTGDTFVLTDKGNIPILDLVGKEVSVWNGESWSKVTPQYTGDKEIYKVSITQYCSKNNSFERIVKYKTLKVSGNHKFYDEAGNPFEIQNISQCSKFLEDYQDPEGEVWAQEIDEVKLSHKEPTYCFNEPIRHRGVFNGVLTGQSEITLPTNKERTAVCCLGSINLEHCPEDKLAEVSALATEALDNVLTVFINSADPRNYKRAIYSASKERSIGLGLMGWHGYLMKNKIPFESITAIAKAATIQETIQKAARLRSEELAIRKGECDDNLGYRNSYLTAIAPTANISVIAGGATPCIEPIAGNAYLQKTLSGSFLVKNKYLEKVLKDKGKNTEKVWSSIIKSKGSVQHLEFLTDEEKKLFKTGYELDQRFVIRQAAARQKNLCQSQSLNLFFGLVDGALPAKYLNEVHTLAWELGVKSLYYLRSESVLGLRVDYDECSACQ